jgi:hypothetical protein
MSKMVRTHFSPSVLDKKESTALYEYLRDNIPWENGVKSKKGFTRLAKAIDLDMYPEILDTITQVLSNFATNNYVIFGTYLNYYSTGDMYTPNHSHKNTIQLVISLGTTRTLVVGKKQYQMSNGDAILFGSSVHGVPKEPAVREGRISIATFMRPFQS